eukprot:816550-Pyramimonas_sp.AAC.1
MLGSSTMVFVNEDLLARSVQLRLTKGDPKDGEKDDNTKEGKKEDKKKDKKENKKNDKKDDKKKGRNGKKRDADASSTSDS